MPNGMARVVTSAPLVRPGARCAHCPRHCNRGLLSSGVLPRPAWREASLGSQGLRPGGIGKGRWVWTPWVRVREGRQVYLGSGKGGGCGHGGGSGRDDDVAIPSALASPRTETQSCT